MGRRTEDAPEDLSLRERLFEEHGWRDSNRQPAKFQFASLSGPRRHLSLNPPMHSSSSAMTPSTHPVSLTMCFNYRMGFEPEPSNNLGDEFADPDP